MIGVSLPFQRSADQPLLQAHWLEQLKNSGVSSVELRTVPANASPEEVYRVAQGFWGFGFQITVHGNVCSEETAVKDVFLPLKKLLENLRQKELIITVHPIDGDNVGVLQRLSDYAAEKAYPVRIALENNRLLPDKREGDCAALVLDAVKRADRPNVGICFDMGHYRYYRLKNHPEEPDGLPEEEFLRNVIHTHIHWVHDFKTHFPVKHGALPLKKYCDALALGYFGAYNLELEPPRFSDLQSPQEAVMQSLFALQENLSPVARMYDDIRQNAPKWASSMASLLERTEGNAFGLLQSTCYFFNTEGFCWSMDPSLRNIRQLAELPSAFWKAMERLRLIIISHGHPDHFEEATVRFLATLPIHWILPDFLAEQGIGWGIASERLHIMKAGESYTDGPLTVTAFSGRHYRPGTDNGVPALGYRVAVENAPSLVFPGDTRDYSVENLPALPQSDYCFGHVWLGDGVCMQKLSEEMAERFCTFMLHFSQKNLLLTHLYENGRDNPFLWRNEHGYFLTEKTEKLSPQTTVWVPQAGEIIELK